MKIRRFIAAGLAAATVLAACGSDDESSDATSAPTTTAAASTTTAGGGTATTDGAGSTDSVPAPVDWGTDEVTFGFINGQSGFVAALGQDELKGAQLAVKLINESGGIGGNGPKIKLDIQDDGADPARTVPIVQDFMQKKYTAIIGTTGGTSMAAMLPVTLGAGYLTMGIAILPAQFAEEADPKLFSIRPSAQSDAVAYAKFIIDKYHPTKVGIINDNNQTGTDQSNLIIEEFEKAGVEVSAHESYTNTDTDFSPQLAKIKASGAEVIYQYGGGAAAALILKQKAELDIAAPTVLHYSALAFGVQNIVDTAGKEATEGLISLVYPTSVWDTLPADDPRYDNVQAFIEAYRAEFGADVQNIGPATTYDLVNVLVAGIIKAGSLDQDDIAAALADLKYQAVLASVDYAANAHQGMAAADEVPAIIKDGKLIYFE